MRTPSRTRTGGTMAIRCSLETVGFLLGLWPGSFCLQSFLPASELSADLFKSCNQIRIFIRWDDFTFPRKLCKKLHNIKFCYCFVQHWYFVFRWQIAQAKCVLKNIKKSLLNFVPDPIPLNLRKITIEG